MLDKSAPIAMLVGMAAGAASMAADTKQPAGDFPPHQSRRQRHRAYTKRALTAVHNLEQSKLVDGMTNWQRTQWQRAGGSYELDTLKHYASLERPKR